MAGERHSFFSSLQSSGVVAWHFFCPSQFCHSRFMQPIDLNYYISISYKLAEQKEQFLWRKRYVCSVNSIGGIICVLAQFPKEVKLI